MDVEPGAFYVFNRPLPEPPTRPAAGWSYSITPIGDVLSDTQIGLLEKLYENFYDASRSYTTPTDGKRSAGGFNIAVWEIVSDGNDALDLMSGNFALNYDNGYNNGHQPTVAINQAAAWLNALYDENLPSGAGNWEFTWLHNDKASDLMIATPVPEPGTWALLLAGLGLLGFISRRRMA